jgi:hypothetical protein
MMNKIMAKKITEETMFGLDNMSAILLTFNQG